MLATFAGRLRRSLPMLDSTQAKVGSSSWKSTARCMVREVGTGVPLPNPSAVDGLLELLLQRERVTTCCPGDELGMVPSGAFSGHRKANSILVKKFNQARVNGESNYDCLKGTFPLFGPKARFAGQSGRKTLSDEINENKDLVWDRRLKYNLIRISITNKNRESKA
uniref:Uncharacterized protein n=1 Tax=Solanum lycopersicum TaxID=4081 RepID=A0A3Q7H7P6_SOLLC